MTYIFVQNRKKQIYTLEAVASPALVREWLELTGKIC